MRAPDEIVRPDGDTSREGTAQVSTPPTGGPPYPGSQPNQPGYDPGQGYPPPQQGYPQDQGYPQGYPQDPGAFQGPGGYPGGPVAQPRNGMGTAALVLGILAVLGAITVIGGILLGLLALIFGIVGLRRVGKGVATNKGVAIAGIVTGLIGLIAAVALAVAGASLFFSTGGGDLVQCIQQAGGDQAQVLQCQQQYQQQVQEQVGGY